MAGAIAAASAVEESGAAEMKVTETLVQVKAPHFTAGLILRGGRVYAAAPILRWAKGKTRDELRAYFKGKGWTASVVSETTFDQRGA